MRTSLQISTAQATEMLTTEQLKSAWLRGDRVELGDPVLAHARLPHRETYYPLGFPVTVTTNASEVLDAAAESWGSFAKMFDVEPLQLNIGVTLSDSHVCPPLPVCRVRDHLVSNVADGENFAIHDRSLGYSFVWVTTTALSHREYFRYFFLESSAMCGIASRYATGIHAACVSLNGVGVLLCGDSGAGKTTLSYACARAGWTFTTDDGSFLVHDRDDRLIVGNCRTIRFRPLAADLFPELRGRCIMERAGAGKPSMEMDTDGNSRITTSSRAAIKHIVFLKRSVPSQELAVFPSAVARLYMMQRVESMHCANRSQVEGIDHLLRIGALELRYNDLDWAVDRLERLAQESV
jgi:hypothetical protein